MFSSTAFVIRPAIEADTGALERLAGLDSQRPLSGPVLLGELHGAPAAAISLDSNRMIADPFQPTAALAAHLRTRAGGIEAAQRTPRLRERIRAGIHVRPRPATAVAA